MNNYEIKCTNCDYTVEIFSSIKEWDINVKPVKEGECPKCKQKTLYQVIDFSTIRIDTKGLPGSVSPTIQKNLDDALRENDHLQKISKTDKAYIQRADELKRFEDKMAKGE